MGAAFSCFKGHRTATPSTDSMDSEDNQLDPQRKGYSAHVEEDAPPVPKSNVLLPLYIYPTPGAWAPLREAIEAYPNVSFTVVINPFDGPGLDDLPEESYQREIPQLVRYANVRVVGYVHTTWTTRDLALVCKDIEKYRRWPERSGIPDLKVTGIFLDETPSVYDAEAEAYLAQVWKQVKKMPQGDENVVIHNPGCVPHVAFLKLADSTVIFEDTYQNFMTRISNAVFSAVALSKVDRSRLGCVIHSIPEDLTPEQWRDLGRQARKIAGNVFVTNLREEPYEAFAPKWMDFVDAMAA